MEFKKDRRTSYFTLEYSIQNAVCAADVLVLFLLVLSRRSAGLTKLINVSLLPLTRAAVHIGARVALHIALQIICNWSKYVRYDQWRMFAFETRVRPYILFIYVEIIINFNLLVFIILHFLQYIYLIILYCNDIESLQFHNYFIILYCTLPLPNYVIMK